MWVSVAWLRLRFCRCNSCSPARSPLARKPLLSHIFIGSLSALDYRVRKEVPATCISSHSRCIYRIRNVGFRELGIWNIGCETSCKMFVFVRGWDTRQKKQPWKLSQKSFYKILLMLHPVTSHKQKKKKIWHDFIFPISADFYFLLSTAESTWKQSSISRKPICFCSHSCGVRLL